MEFQELNLNINDNIKPIKINDKVIQVKQYLPISSKINLVQLTLQQAMEDGIYNAGLLDAYFNTFIVMYYTDLEFTDEQKQDILSLFDMFEGNGVIDAVCNVIPQVELEDLTSYLNEQKSYNMTYKTSASYLIGQFIDALPSQMEKVGDIINNFDPNKYAEVVNFATAANGGRNINTNEPMAPIEN